MTGLAAVPPIWIQLADLRWPEGARQTLRYITNSGGAMPQTTLAKLRQALPQTRVFLMYGLTEAFRSTYLPPEELDRRPDSIGKAIPGRRDPGAEARRHTVRTTTSPASWCTAARWCRSATGMTRNARRSGSGPVPPAAGGRPLTGTRSVVGRHRATRCGGIPVLHRPPRRDDQDLGLCG